MRLNGGGKFGRLDHEQIRAFAEALIDAFPTVSAVDDLFAFYLERNRQAVALGSDLAEIIRNIIAKAEGDSWTAELLAAARTAKPSNDALILFGQGFGTAPAIPETRELQRKIREANGAMDPVPWRTRMALIEGQVCRVEVYSGQPPEFGTGFLLGPSVVMTNYHVIESLLRPKDPVPPEKLVLRFDYKARADGIATRSGTTYALADNKWLLDLSPASQYDESGGPGEPAADELDYALLAVKGAPGNDPVGRPIAGQNPAPPPRGWIDLPQREHEFKPNSAVWIMQHPEGGPLKFTMDTQSVMGLNNSRTRVRYKTNTEPGSSGSPCFDADWNLVAVHHSGDKRTNADYNEGIPLAAILALMSKHGTRALLGPQT